MKKLHPILQTAPLALAAMAFLGHAPSVAQQQDGPFAVSGFARVGSTAPKATAGFHTVQAPSSPKLSPPTFDAHGLSNELIVRLNPSLGTRVATLMPHLAPDASAPEVERSVVAAAAQTGNALNAFLGTPVSARHLLSRERLSDAERVLTALRSDPAEALNSYLVLRYASVAVAQAAMQSLSGDDAIVSVSNNRRAVFSALTNDPYLPPVPVFGGTDPKETRKRYQWGMNAMKFPDAWDKARGQGYVGVVGEAASPVDFLGAANPRDEVHVDLRRNYRGQFEHLPRLWSIYSFHSMHVSGIVAAESNNLQGVAGGCNDCSVTVYPYRNGAFGTKADWIEGTTAAIDAGMQVLNWSGNLVGDVTCATDPEVCAVMDLAKKRDVLLVQAAGNFRATTPPFPSNQYKQYWVMPVGGTEIENPATGLSGSLWTFDAFNGSSYPSASGVLGPAKSVVSLSPRNANYNGMPYAMCGDVPGVDESTSDDPTRYGDGYGSCTGTSMAAPHITALAGLVRSIHPRLPAKQLRNILRESGNLASSGPKTAELGWGLPNANLAVDKAVAKNPLKLAPLFSFYSVYRSDSFYTTVPQMARAALVGSLKPRNTGFGVSQSAYAPAYGVEVFNYTEFPGAGAVFGGTDETPLAEVMVFTTPGNPKEASRPLVPLVRMSWKCGEPTFLAAAPDICATQPTHSDTAYTTDLVNGVPFFESIGYKMDGLEGYVYPIDAPQPAGTVRLMRKYNPERDDHAIFPETKLAEMQARGYVQNTGLDWIGYVYLNTGEKFVSLP
jgi:serine protease